MTDQQLIRTLKRSQAAVEEGRAPDFGDAFAAAVARAHRQTRRRRVAGGLLAAAALAVVVANLLPAPQPDWQYVDPEQFASATSWTAPSDVLLPERRFDIYDEIPVLIESTETDGGTLL